MIDLYALTSPNVQKIFIMLEETGLPYNFKPVDVWASEQYAEAFGKLNPNRKIPVIVDHEGPGGKPYTVFESGAILMYLADKSGKFLPKDTARKYDALQWLMIQLTGVGPAFGNFTHFNLFAPKPNDYALSRYKTELLRLYDLIDQRLLIQRGKLMEIGDVQIVASRMTQEDWSSFLSAVPPHGARFVYPALAFTERYAPGAIPEAVLSALAAHLAPALREWCARVTLVEASESNPRSRSGIGLDMARMLARSRVERARMWLRSLFPRRWNLVKRYPRLAASPLYPLCYLLINLDRAWHILMTTLEK